MRESGGHNPKREDFLIAMYGQMWQNINRHILVVWQSVGVLAGAFALLALAEKQIISLDWAVSFIILIVAWLVGHVLDANGWYNRNLVILSNIERQFLSQADLQDVHYYFGKHREDSRLIEQFQLQFGFGVGIAVLVLLYHIWTRVVPGIGSPISRFDPPRAIPYAVTIIASVLLYRFWKNQGGSYDTLVQKSPGIEIGQKADSSVPSEKPSD